MAFCFAGLHIVALIYIYFFILSSYRAFISIGGAFWMGFGGMVLWVGTFWGVSFRMVLSFLEFSLALLCPVISLRGTSFRFIGCIWSSH